MKHLITLSLFVFMMNISTVKATDVVLFTTQEGFTDGALFNQENWDATFTFPGNWIVNTATGSLSADKTYQWARLRRYYHLNSVGDKITIRVEFDCEIESMPTSNSLMTFGFIAKPTVGTSAEDNPKMNLIHLKKAATVVQLRNNANSANLSPTAILNLTDIDDAESTRTKLLAVEVSLTLGNDAAGSVISGKLFNITDNTSSDLGSYTGINTELFNAVATNGIHATFSTAANNCQPVVYKVSVTESNNMSESSAKVFFRSNKSGSWATGSVWDISSDSISWTESTRRPQNNINSVVDIMSGHTVSVNSVQDAKVLNLNPGSQLTVLSGLTSKNLTIRSSTDGTATLYNNGGALTVTGSARVHQYLTGGRNWYISSPVSSANASVITGTSGNAFYAYNEQTGLWPSATSFETGKGFVASIGASNTGIYTFTGTLNSGEKSIAVQRLGSTKAGFNLVGNPYPAYLVWTEAIADAANLEPTVWYRTKPSSYAFHTFNVEGSISSPQGLNNEIPPMQAFWVRVVNGETAGTITLNNTNQKHGNQSTNKLKAPAEDTRPIVRLSLSVGEKSDETVLYFTESASNQYDRFDSQKMFNNQTGVPEIYTLAGTEQVVINGLSAITNGLSVPVGITGLSTETAILKASQLHNIPKDTQLFVVDGATGNEYNLSTGDVVNIDENSSNRFSLLFRTSLVTTSLEGSSTNNTRISIHQQKIQLTTNATLAADASLIVYTSVGQMVGRYPVNSTSFTSSENLKTGVYLVVFTNSQQDVIQRVIIP